MISVVDYGAGNLRSVANTLDAIGTQYELVRDRTAIGRATKIVLPGVGHFGQMMRALDDMDLRSALIERIRAGVPFLGICLGLQALFTSSEEAPGVHGLALFEGAIRRFTGDVRIPHMGWNQIETLRPARLVPEGERPFVYFAHSYYAPLVAATAATCEYTVPYTAVLEHQNIFGVQFHPEKSGPVGLQIVRNFVSC